MDGVNDHDQEVGVFVERSVKWTVSFVFGAKISATKSATGAEETEYKSDSHKPRP